MEKLRGSGVRFIASYPKLAHIYFRILYTGDAPYRDQILRESHGDSLRFVQTFIEQGIERGELRPDIDPKIVSFMLQSLLDRFLQAHYLPFLHPAMNLGEENPDESRRWIKELIKVYQEGMANNLSSNQGGTRNGP